MGIRAQSVGSGGPRKDAQPAEVPESSPQVYQLPAKVLDAIEVLKAKARAQNSGGEASHQPVSQPHHSAPAPAPSRIVPFHKLPDDLQERTLGGIHWEH